MKRGLALKGIMCSALFTVALPMWAQDEKTPVSGAADKTAGAGDPIATVIIDDLRGLTDNATALAKKFAPDNPQTDLRAMAGMLVGDADLSGFPKGAGAMAQILQGGGMAFAEVSTAKQDTYVKLIESRGIPVAKAEGIIVMGTTPELLAEAKKAAGAAKKKLETGTSQGIRLELPVAKLLKQYDAQAKMLLQMLPAKLNEQAGADDGSTTAPQASNAMVAIVDAEARLGYRLLQRVDTAVVTLAPSAEGLMMDYNFTPLNPTKSTTTLPTVESLRNLIPGSGSYRAVMTFDNKGLMGMLRTEMKAVLTEMQAEEKVAKSIDDSFAVWEKMGGNGWAYNMILPGKGMMSGSMIIAANDPATALDDMEKLMKLMEDAGILEMYSKMGLPVKWEFKRKAREIEGKEVAQFTFIVEDTTAPTSQTAMMTKMMKDATAEITVAGNYIVYSFGKGGLEEAVAAVKAGKHPQTKPLQAEAALGAGGRVYADYAIGEIMASTSEMSDTPQAAAMKKMADAVKDASPMMFGGFHKDSDYRFSIMIPVDMMLAFQKGGQAMQQSVEDSATTGTTEGAATPQ